MCRSDYPLEDNLREKIALFCNVSKENVLQNLDAASLYEVPLMLEEENLASAVCSRLALPCPEPDLMAWRKLVDDQKHPLCKVTVAIVGKYVSLHDAYLSVAEALRHAGIANRAEVNIRWTDSESITDENVKEILSGADAVLVPGGFGGRGIKGKISSIKYARQNNIPFLGICLGMQLAIIEFARNVCGIKDADSAEFCADTPDPVIHIMPDKEKLEDIGGTLRLGAYPCTLAKGSKAYELYGTEHISERHRHRYEVNNEYRDILTGNKMMISGLSPDGRIVEMVELSDHPFFVATQAHPEFKSRPDMPHPLFTGLVEAALKNRA